MSIWLSFVKTMPPHIFKPHLKAVPWNSPTVSGGISQVEQDILGASVQVKGFRARGDVGTGSESRGAKIGHEPLL
ncbi:hypothetical protein EYC80_003886 [Monilinia laxa]|uniref:Uncharacterized protein n=1 Tax=Monilinia laxa TaxID=61186 RepID=A0A5N6KLH0_MONLA|nr:hypothetical protein EYC80_003886 [Monilinia laxa]